MTLPAVATKVNLDASTDDPKLARAELADLVDKFNALLTHLGLSTILSTPLTLGVGVVNNAGAMDVRSASTTQTGIAELATDAEAIAKSDTARILTPSNLAALSASETFAGFIELATNAEALTGTDTARGITPASLAHVLSNTGSIVLLSTQNASSSASIDFTAALNSTYSRYILEIYDYVPSTAQQVLCRVNTGGGYISTSTYDQNGDGRDSEGNPQSGEAENASSISISAMDTIDATGSNGNCFRLEIINPSHSGKRTWINYFANYMQNSTTRWRSARGGASNQTTSAVTGIQILPSTGTITSGTFKLYGVK